VLKEYFGNEIFVKNKLGNSRGTNTSIIAWLYLLRRIFFPDKIEMKIASLVCVRAAPTIDF
jgi:hypothetical protein